MLLLSENRYMSVRMGRPTRDPEETKAFAERLRARRIDVGLSQAALASAIGVVSDVVGRWERNEATPGSDKIDAMAAALGCDPSWLLTGSVNTSSDDPPYAAWNSFITSAREADEPITDEEEACLRAIRLPAGRQPRQGFYVVVWQQMRHLSEQVAAPRRPSRATAGQAPVRRQPRRSA